ncbi:MAG: MFS transporter small subunit, partial [Nocardioidaceae bacterium]
IIISFYGGGFATVPAYLRDLFGVFQVGAIHGRLLTAWAAAGVAGPLIINGFLDSAGGAGTLTSDAYRPALFTMVGVLAVGFVANLLIRPVASRFHEDLSDHHAEAASEREAAMEQEKELTPASTQTRLVVSWGVVSLLLAYGVYETVATALNLF